MVSEMGMAVSLCHAANLSMLSLQLPTLPWQVVGVDLFHHEQNEYLIVVDSYSFFFEVRQLNCATAAAVINASAEIFVTHGIPAKVEQ